MPLLIREMRPEDYRDVMALWRASEGVGLSSADEEAAIGRFLDQNAGMSLVALVDGALAGAVMAGHDGRRGYLYHLAVAPEHRWRGIGRALAEQCLRRLAGAGIRRCHVHVFAHNQGARSFWQAIGWQPRDDLVVLCCDCEEANA